jgi:outer membrane protein OmpA-like peptidoglycan-associated protein
MPGLPTHHTRDDSSQSNFKKGSIVNTLNLNVIALAVGMALGAQSMAAELSAADYAAAEKKIELDFSTAKAACAPLSGNAGKICMVEATGKEAIAKADLDAKNLPSPDALLQAQIARAEAGFALAKERCNDVTAADQAQCIQTAETAEATARAKADRDMRAALTNVQPSTETNDERSDGGIRATDTLFDFDSAALRPAGRTSLDDFVDKSKANSSAQFTVVGYADRLGAAPYNQQLSERRAQAVMAYLVGEGIDANRIHDEGMGQADPSTTANECQGERTAAVVACLQPDRRVVVTMTGLTSSR